MAAMTIAEAAATLGVSPETIRRRARRGELPSRRDGRGRYLVDVELGLPPLSALASNDATLHAVELLRLRQELDQAMLELGHRDELIEEARRRAARAESESDRLQQQLAAATVRELQLLVQVELHALVGSPEVQAAQLESAPAGSVLARPAARRRKRWWRVGRRSPGVAAGPEPTRGELLR